MVDLREVLKDLSRRIKKGEPITLSEITVEPPAPNSIELVDLATIRDVLRRNKEGIPQAFSGVSDDFTTPEA